MTDRAHRDPAPGINAAFAYLKRAYAPRVSLRWRLRKLYWSAGNRLHGYKFGPVRRFRCCEHTTPYHAAQCRRPR